MTHAQPTIDPAPTMPPPAADQQPDTTPTIITFLLDRSSSMELIKPATIEAFNAYLDGLSEAPSTNTTLTLVQFDTVSVDKTFIDKTPAKAPRLTDLTFQPRGGTPLVDAAYEVIEATERKVAAHDQTPKVIVCIQTDGQENSSTQHTFAELCLLIKRKTADGWQFNFMGAGIDAYQQASLMGLGAAQTMSYDASNLQATRSAYQGRAASHAMYASGQSMDTHITSAEKLSAGDAYDPSRNAAGAPQTPKSGRTGQKPVLPGGGHVTVGKVPRSKIIDKVDL